jgi:hypothetical protein
MSTNTNRAQQGNSYKQQESNAKRSQKTQILNINEH